MEDGYSFLEHLSRMESKEIRNRQREREEEEQTKIDNTLSLGSMARCR